MEPTEPVAEDAGELLTKKKGSKGLPPGIFEHRSGKLQARLCGVKVDGKAYQRPIPGLYKDREDALEAQAASMLLFKSGGVEAVWPPKEVAPAERNKRGQVRHPAKCSCIPRVLLTHCSCALAGLEETTTRCSTPRREGQEAQGRLTSVQGRRARFEWAWSKWKLRAS